MKNLRCVEELSREFKATCDQGLLWADLLITLTNGLWRMCPNRILIKYCFFISRLDDMLDMIT